jgi:hypothetical protein
MESTIIDYTHLKTIKQLADKASFVTESKLRWWIFHCATNGMASAIIKIGGRVYIDRLAFNRWLEGQRLAPLNDN